MVEEKHEGAEAAPPPLPGKIGLNYFLFQASLQVLPFLALIIFYSTAGFSLVQLEKMHFLIWIFRAFCKSLEDFHG